MRRVIFFPAHTGAKPEFRWLNVHTMLMDKGDGSTYQTPDVQSLLGDGSPQTIRFDENLILGAKLNLGINVCFDDNFLDSYSSANTAILTATNRKAGHEWRGPVVAYCGKRVDPGDFSKIEDMDMASVTDVAAFLIDYYNKTMVHKLRKGPKVPGVKAFCFGEPSKERAKAVLVPRMHPVFEVGEVSAISKNVGMPLLLSKDAVKITGPYVTGTYCNPALTFMMVGCDSNQRSDFGWAPLKWMGGEVPNTLIVRLDRQPLNIDQVVAFGDYCYQVLRPVFEIACEKFGETGKHGSAAQRVMDTMTPEKWNAYLAAWDGSDKWWEEQRAEKFP
ncbi:unnamed protein product [Zymoseptoria tritici ST99CH_1A5]|uniref:Uncharacterized protein n=1 Tax=Zymoseptoria tritici ST99CH_1A5 TaxID=1276529 RepID=A0A1Y6LSY5_ZYMTR|nr:unnamed protein product [Zymoseptoria tritici ST99CH_1A5]